MGKMQKTQRRKEKMMRVLSVLGRGALCTIELLDELFNYHEFYKRARQRLYNGGYESRRELFAKFGSRHDDAERQAFYSLLTRLKDQELIEKSKGTKGTLWKITTAGFNKLVLLKDKAKPSYDAESDNKLKIIAYDVPEKERFKRLWLCEALEVMNFKRLQKSLAVGKSKIPERFLEDLRKKKMLPYIHIFEVSKTGTIKELV